MIVVLSVISVLGITAAIYYLNTRVEYGILFTDLSDADAGTISKGFGGTADRLQIS